MLRWWKARFAKDRWEVLRITHWQHVKREGILETQLNLRNRYNRKTKLKKLQGEWRALDFPGNTYRG